MKNVLPYIFMMFGLSAWGQTPIQVQTKTGNYDLSDAYSITFEDAGRIQVIKSQSQGELRIPTADLNQIHFNDTAVSLVNQIRNLEGCEIMKTILFDGVKDMPSDFFWRYMNSPSVTKILIPNDEAFLYIPASALPLQEHGFEMYSVSVSGYSDYPLTMRVYDYDPFTGTKGLEKRGERPSQSDMIEFLQRLILNQMVVGTEFPAYTAAGSEIDFSSDAYQGTFQKWALQSEWQNIPEAHVVGRFDGPDGKECMIVDRVVAETCLPTYSALSDIAPSFLELMDVPVQFLLDCGYIDAAHVASVSFFEDVDGYKRFCWTSSRVNYTIFAPSDEAIEEAINAGNLYTWQMIQDNPSNALEKISKTMAFIKRHICFGNVLIDIPQGSKKNLASCNLLPSGVAQSLSVEHRAASDEFVVGDAKATPASIRYVRDPWKKNSYGTKYNPFMNLNLVTGVVMQIDKAIVDEY